MLATVDSVVRFSKADCPSEVLSDLKTKLSFRNPEYLQAVKYGGGGWGIPQTLDLFEEDEDGEVTLPRGAVPLLRQLMSDARAPLHFKNELKAFESVSYSFNRELRDYQAEAVEALLDRVQGVVVAPCGSGKSTIGAAVIARTGQHAIILCHTHDLLDQWVGVIRDCFGIEANIIRGNLGIEAAMPTRTPAPITVGMVQTLSQMPASVLAEVGQRFGCVVLDECHHCPASTFRTLFQYFPGRWRIGLSATPTRADGLSGMLTAVIGRVVFEVGHERLVADGHLVIPEVKVIKTGCHPDVDNHVKLVTALIKDEGRNRLIVDLAAKEAREGHTVLVLSQRVGHCELLATDLRAMGIKAEALTGETKRADRDTVLDRLRAGALQVLVSTQLADEGLDVPTLDRIILATPSRSEGRTVQRIGRAMRPAPGKGTPVIFDLLDSHSIARSQHYARQAAYRSVLGAHPMC